jgi:hypothetical protein
MDRCDDPQAMLGSAQRAVVGLCDRASSARSLAELREIDHLVTRAIFESLCNRDIPMPLVSALVWPAVAALSQQASLLQIAWKPTLSRGDWDGALPESPHATRPLRAVSTGSYSGR